MDMDERTLEDIICRYPELIENGLSFKGRQVTVNGKRVDVLFEDRHGQKLILEIKKGTVLRNHVGQLLDYEGDFVSVDNPNVRVMLVGNRVPENLRRSLNHHGFEWKELTISALDNFLNEKEDIDLLNRLISKEPPIRDYHQVERYPSSDSHQESALVAKVQRQSEIMNQKAFVLRIAPSEMDRVPEALEDNQIIIGWADADGLLDPRLTKKNFTEIIQTQHKEYASETNFRRAGIAAGHMWRFIREMNAGDLVVVPHWSELRGAEFYVAEIEGPAIYIEHKVAEDTAYRRPVKWLNNKRPIPRHTAKLALFSLMKRRGTCTDATDLMPEINDALQNDSSS